MKLSTSLTFPLSSTNTEEVRKWAQLYIPVGSYDQKTGKNKPTQPPGKPENPGNKGGNGGNQGGGNGGGGSGGGGGGNPASQRLQVQIPRYQYINTIGQDWQVQAPGGAYINGV